MAKMDLDDARTGSGRDRAPNVGDLVDVYKFPDKKWVTLRLGSGLFSRAGYWIVTKKRDGSKGKFPAPCASYDPESQERDSTIPDPWRDLAAVLRDGLSEDERKKKDAMLIQFQQEWFMPAIIRSIQKGLPDRLPKPTPSERKSGFKEKDSDSLTAWRAVKLGKSLLGKLQELKGLNTVESKSGAVKAFSVNDPKFGRDIRIYFDKDKAPADQYQVQLGDKRTPLTEEEQAMLGWDLESACAPVTAGMDEEQLDKLADDMGVDTTGKDKAEVVAAVAEEPVEVPDISKMKLDELKEFAEDNGIDLTGCTTKASILQKIREYEADAAAAAAIIAPEG
jgi:NACalpha-BTF3-like transcription factor